MPKVALCHQGLTMQNAYTELRKGSKNAVLVVRNSMAYPQTLKKKTLVARAVATIVMPELPAETRLQERADEPEGPHTPKLSIRQRQGKLFKELDLSGLELWPLNWQILPNGFLPSTMMSFHWNPLNWAAPTLKHVIKVTDDTSFKECLGRFPHLWWKRFITTCERC